MNPVLGKVEKAFVHVWAVYAVSCENMDALGFDAFYADVALEPADEVNSVKTEFFCQFFPCGAEIVRQEFGAINQENGFVADFNVSVVSEKF